MATNNAKIKLRAFRIENSTLTEPHSGILALLQQVLTDSSTAQQRRMKLKRMILMKIYCHILHGNKITHTSLV